MTDETTMLCPECYQPRGHCEHTEGESMFGPAQPAPDADHEHDWRLAYGDTEGRRGYDCAVPGCPAELTAGPDLHGREHPDARHERKPTPQVGDRVQLGYEHPDYPGEVGTVAEVKPSRIEPETNMVRVTFDVWVAEEELR